MDLQTIILGIVGALLSLVFTYYAPAQKWYDAQANKGLLMLGLIALVSVAYFALGCWPAVAVAIHIAVSCSQAGAFALVQVFVTVALGNQGAYLLSQPGTPK